MSTDRRARLARPRRRSRGADARKVARAPRSNAARGYGNARRRGRRDVDPDCERLATVYLPITEHRGPTRMRIIMTMTPTTRTRRRFLPLRPSSVIRSFLGLGRHDDDSPITVSLPPRFRLAHPSRTRAVMYLPVLLHERDAARPILT